MKKFLLLFLTAALCLGLFGCQQVGEGQETTTSEEITTPEEEIRSALAAEIMKRLWI